MPIQPFGWVSPAQRTPAVQQRTDEILSYANIFGDVAAPLTDSGKGKISLPHKALVTLCGGRFPVNRQEIGDCVSHGWAKAVEILIAVRILLQGMAEEWPGALVATEWIYGASRVLQGQGQLGNDDGSIGAWAAEAVKDNGTLLRRKYGDYDLSQYSGSRAKEWGYRGLPAKQLEPTADEHPVKKTVIARSYEEARDLIANLYPVAVCSDQGFEEKRDKQGFAKPKGTWMHCMVFVAADDQSSRPGLLCVNSWGEDWISGPLREDLAQPEGSMMVDAEVADRMLRQGDSFAPSQYEGFPAQTLDYDLW